MSADLELGLLPHLASLLLACLVCCLSAPTFRLISRLLASQARPSVFNRGLALALATSGTTQIFSFRSRFGLCTLNETLGFCEVSD